MTEVLRDAKDIASLTRGSKKAPGEKPAKDAEDDQER